ncbi:hypothetical protein NMY22_g18530 [Coprinellus aureogranulatus]|nr:hypothetical protein NMY22_g18530 [Coprinellus aureogranulatus]
MTPRCRKPVLSAAQAPSSAAIVCSLCVLSSPPTPTNTDQDARMRSNIQANADPVASLLGLLGVVLDVAPNVPVGVTCTPISVIGVGGNSCNAQTVCCENNSFNGLVAVGCTPVNVNL